MRALKFPVSEQTDRSESEHAGFVTPIRLVSLPDMVKQKLKPFENGWKLGVLQPNEGDMKWKL